VHGEDVSSLFDIYIGSSHVYYTPKIRFERLIYRGVREAANAARSVEQRERRAPYRYAQERVARRLRLR